MPPPVSVGAVQVKSNFGPMAPTPGVATKSVGALACE